VDGAAELEVKAYDARGKKLDKTTVKIAAPWDDGGAGVNVLPTDDDPLTTVAFLAACSPGSPCWRRVVTGWDLEKNTRALVVVSDGWTLGDALPEVAEMEIEGGDSWTAPANAYPVTSLVHLGDVDLDLIETLEVDGSVLTKEVSSKNKKRYVNADRVVFVDTDDSGAVWASVTAWAAHPATLPTDAVLTVDGVDVTLAFDDEVAIVFGIEVEVTTDAQGLDCVGKVKLQGAANKKGKRDTLAKGKFAGQFGTDADGETDFGSINKAGDTVSRGDIPIGGEPIDLEMEVEGEVVPVAPPALVYKPFSNGSGTRKVATTNNGSPGLL
jgi:hypothetical protein